ncbi:hypothetical protein [Falsirhodobacter halotolerans]|uniref:hypothetical protein n=1 Tax=Falsirhodobacter halotolerans TaxID=1146892 RepID=UPI001FD12533|nr:hypothetical protein [Falsirhodobacter halotolerans]MCJ8139948.1 hypothetical protein [Falsirhodobacter halotolerans]
MSITRIKYTIDGNTREITDASELAAMRHFAAVLDGEGIIVADSNMSQPMIDDLIRMSGQSHRISFVVSSE